MNQRVTNQCVAHFNSKPHRLVSSTTRQITSFSILVTIFSYKGCHFHHIILLNTLNSKLLNWITIWITFLKRFRNANGITSHITFVHWIIVWRYTSLLLHNKDEHWSKPHGSSLKNLWLTRIYKWRWQLLLHVFSSMKLLEPPFDWLSALLFFPFLVVSAFTPSNKRTIRFVTSTYSRSLIIPVCVQASGEEGWSTCFVVDTTLCTSCTDVR